MNTKKLNQATIITSLSDNEYINVTLSDGSLGRIKKSDLLPFSGVENKSLNFENIGWYRIAIQDFNNRDSSGIFNIGNDYWHTEPKSVCFYLSGSGYGGRIVNVLGKNGLIISKVRFIYKRSTTEPLYVDIYYPYSSNNILNVSLAAGNNIRLQNPVLVSEDIPTGYLVEEFTL